ncbi:GMC oxidoreductase [Corynebacterium variabile]|uniref:GMC oxidoreductase n=1 Tax=Corynebacterium variabile TaxID=1727 RepID=UPI003A933D81
MHQSPSRRHFLVGAAALGISGAIASQVGQAGKAAAQSSALGSSDPAPLPGDITDNVPTVEEKRRVVIIGSGFGGGVSALRLAEAGVPVTVLERGRRWETGPDATTFPSATSPDKRFLWHRSAPQLFGKPFAVDPYVGILEAVVSPTMTALCPTALGGGSLVCQGMSLEPTKEIFNAHFPVDLDWDLMHRVHYPRVAAMLQLETCPDDIIASSNHKVARVFAQRCRDAGLEPEKIPMPIDWDFARRELRGEMTPSYTDGSGAMGVNNGGKHSVDVTYIARAEATGLAEVRTHTEVTDVERADDGTWKIHALFTDDAGTVLERHIITADAVVMGAGSVNTTRLLLRAKNTGTVPDLPDALGEGWGTNGDRIYIWSDPGAGFGPVQGGPVVYGTKQWDDVDHAHTVIQASMPGMGVDIASTMMVGYGVSDTRGSFRWDAASGQAELHWPAGGDGELIEKHIRPTADRIISAGSAKGMLTDTNAMVNSTWHSLGSACMGTVCDLEGRVKGQKGLYVLDGALIPGSTLGCNPSMTIAAVAERAMDRIVAQDVDRVF